jgi:hypothetical protein
LGAVSIQVTPQNHYLPFYNSLKTCSQSCLWPQLGPNRQGVKRQGSWHTLQRHTPPSRCLSWPPNSTSANQMEETITYTNLTWAEQGSVQSKKCIHPSALPDAGLVLTLCLRQITCVDTFYPLFLCPKSRSKRVDYHGGNSSLIFTFATIITHSLFKTNQTISQSAK